MTAPVPSPASLVARLIARPWFLALVAIGLTGLIGWYVAGLLDADFLPRILATVLPPVTLLLLWGLGRLLLTLWRWASARRIPQGSGVDPQLVSRLRTPLANLRAERDRRPWLIHVHAADQGIGTDSPELRPLAEAEIAGGRLAVLDTDELVLVECVLPGASDAGELLDHLMAVLGGLGRVPWRGLCLPGAGSSANVTPELARQLQDRLAETLGCRLPVWLLGVLPMTAAGWLGEQGRGVRITRQYGRGGDDLAELTAGLERLGELACRERGDALASADSGPAVTRIMNTPQELGARLESLLEAAEAITRPLAGRPAGPLAGAWLMPSDNDASLLAAFSAIGGQFGAPRPAPAHLGRPLQKLAQAAVIMVMVLATGGLFWQLQAWTDAELDRYRQAAEGVQVLETELERETKNRQREVTALKRLIEVRNQVHAGTDRRASSLLRPRGTLDADLAEAMDRTLFHAMDAVLRTASFHALEDRLAKMNDDWRRADGDERDLMRSEYHDSLAVYLMLTRYPEQMDRDTTVRTLEQIWQQDSELARLLEPRGATVPVDFYLTLLGAEHHRLLYRHEVDEQLVTAARQDLSVEIDVDALYAGIHTRLKRELGEKDLAKWLGDELAGALTTEQTLNRFWTREAWLGEVGAAFERGARDVVHGDWVLGTAQPGEEVDEITAEQAEILEGLWSRYEQDYARAWRDFNASLRPAGDTPEDLAESLAQLADEEQGLATVWAGIADNLAAPESIPEELAGRARAAMGLDGEALPPSLGALDEALPGLYRLAIAGRDNGDAIATLRDDLAVLAEEMKTLAGDADTREAARAYAADMLSGDRGSRALSDMDAGLDKLAASLDIPGGEADWGLAEAVIDIPWRHLLALARSALRQEWRGEVYQHHDRHLAGRYPFQAGDRDADPEALAEFLRPDGGRLWRFLAGPLESFVRERDGAWADRTWRGRGVGMRPAMREGLAQAAAIRDHLFDASGARLSVPLEVYPIPRASLAEVRLRRGAESFRYRNEPQVWHRLDWPADNAHRGELRAIRRAGQGQASLDASGPWALFRLIDAAAIESRGDRTFDARWELDVGEEAQPVRLRFRAEDGAEALFVDEIMRGFSLPEDPFRA